ncbi:OmpA family protein [Pelomonas sp. KK5]|uniref:OmpA family protein n=1 Tax=Pelomonas sp. KK5 TaxID=1855730 RepID=UPI00097BE939|nr:OmpA family protein [Pelomonas sp. KK5]
MRALAAVLLLLLLQACCAPRERVILLPGSEGRATGALLVQRGAQQLRLHEPYAQSLAPRGTATLQPGSSSAETVQRDFRSLLDIQPPMARSFIVNFLANANTLTPETLPVLDQVRESLAAQPAGELVVIGHTDNVGSDDANDQLALDRATVVADQLVARGVARERISVQARGMREPLVQVPPQTAEARNRRVEIKLR